MYFLPRLVLIGGDFGEDYMAKDRLRKNREASPVPQGVAMLRRVFPMLQVLARSGTERDRAGNREFQYSHYAALILIGLFNPVLTSARALVGASGFQRVRRLTGGKKVSLGAFSEASTVFDPKLLQNIMRQLQQDVSFRRHRSRMAGGNIPSELVERLVAVDGSVLTALPQVVGRYMNASQGQFRLHAQVRVYDRMLLDERLTQEPSTGPQAERNVLADSVANSVADQAASCATPDIPMNASSHLFLMDRGYRSASLFNQIHAAGHDYICRLNRTDGTPAEACHTTKPITLPELSESARAQGIIADELITMGGHCGASKVQSDHPLRRITVVPAEQQASSARQGRVRTDQGGREEMVLGTNLLGLPADQIVALYRYRWQVELFFRFLKHVLKCEKLIAAKERGVAMQIYCALIAGLLIALVTGNNLTIRAREVVQLYFQGWVDDEELREAMERLNKPPTR